MQLFTLKKHTDIDEIIQKIENIGGIIIKRDFIQSKKELLLAEHLAKKSFGLKRNIARDFRYEFLLWLAGTRDIKNAIRKTKAERKANMLIILFSKPSKELIGSMERYILTKESCDPLVIERISLSRI